MSTVTRLALTTIRTRGRDSNWSLRCEAAAAFDSGYDRSLLLVSAIGPATTVKALAAMLHGNARLDLRCDGLGSYLELERSVHGYRASRHNLGRGVFHTMIVAKDPRFLPVVDDEAIWHRLRSSDYTTPILRAWVPWLTQKFRDHKLLILPRAFGCQPGCLSLSTEQLDALVQQGIRGGHLKIQ